MPFWIGRRSEHPTEVAGERSFEALAITVFGQLSEAEREIFAQLATAPPPVVPLLAAPAQAAAAPAEVSKYRLSRPSTLIRRTVGGAEPFGLQRTVRSALVQWLCRHEERGARLVGRRIEIRRALFDGLLNLSFLELPAPLVIAKCRLPAGLELVDTKASSITLDGSWIGPPGPAAADDEDAQPVLLAEGLRATGTVSLRDGVHVEGEVDLIGADIGHLTCSASVFHNPAGRSLVLDRATIRGDVFLRRGFSSTGLARLAYAKVHGDLDCSDASFAGGEDFALALDGATIDGDVLFNKKNGMQGFRASGVVRLPGATIGRSLECIGATMTGGGDVALQAERVKIGGNVFLGVTHRSIRDGWNVARDGWGFDAAGEVRLFGATIGADVICHAAHLRNIDGVALNLEGAQISGSVMARFQFLAEGEVRLFASKIGGNLDCRKARFLRPGKTAIAVARTQIGLSAEFCDGFQPEGRVLIEGSVIGRDLTFAGADLAHDSGASLQIRNTEVKGTLVLKDMKLHAATEVDLANSSCGILADDPASWPGDGHTVLDGLVYRRLEAPGTAASRHAWLQRQMPDDGAARVGRFRPQPYQDAVRVLREQGLSEEARRLLILTAIDRRKWSGMGRGSRVWHWVLWHLMRDGYRPMHALRWLAVWWFVGFLAFGAGYQAHMIQPLDKEAVKSFAASGEVAASYEPFCALSYAVDSALPIVSLGQRDKWHVAPADGPPVKRAASRGALYAFVCRMQIMQGWLTRIPAWAAAAVPTALVIFRWVFVLVGWFLTTMLVAGVAGLVARD